jgi:hypothetical protein
VVLYSPKGLKGLGDVEWSTLLVSR